MSDADSAMDALAECADVGCYVVVDPKDEVSFAATASPLTGRVFWLSPQELVSNRYAGVYRSTAKMIHEQLVERFGEHLLVCLISDAIEYSRVRGWL